MFAINGGFAGQRVTGQQRYAGEMAAALVDRGATLLEPRHPTASPARGWAWTQTVLPLHARGHWMLSLTPRAPVAHRRQVITVHDLFALTHPEWYSARYLRVHAPLLRHHLRTAAGVVVSSPTARDQLATSGLLPTSTPVVVAPCAPTPLQPGGLPDGAEDLAERPYFLSVASLEPRKNVDRLVRAYAMLPRHLRQERPLVLVGGTHSAFAETRSGTDVEGVRRLGYIEDSALAALYQPHAVLVSVSHAEGFGLPVIESAAGPCGLLLSDLPVYRWLAGDDATFVDPLDDASVSRGLAEAAARPASARRTATIDRFTWTSSADVVWQLFEDLAGA